MHSSFAGLYHFKEGGVGSWGGVYGIGGEPEVLLTIIDHFPYFFEELVPIDNEIFKWEMFNSP
jgi:hypothetical protein